MVVSAGVVRYGVGVDEAVVGVGVIQSGVGEG